MEGDTLCSGADLPNLISWLRVFNTYYYDLEEENDPILSKFSFPTLEQFLFLLYPNLQEMVSVFLKLAVCLWYSLRASAEFLLLLLCLCILTEYSINSFNTSQ